MFYYGIIVNELRRKFCHTLRGEICGKGQLYECFVTYLQGKEDIAIFRQGGEAERGEAGLRDEMNPYWDS